MKQHEAAGPQEKLMSQSFGIFEDGQLFIRESEMRKSQLFLSGVGVSLPPDFAELTQEKADRLERRLARVEQELGLAPLS